MNEITNNTSFLFPVTLTIVFLLFLIFPADNVTFVDNLSISVYAQPQTLGNNTSVSISPSLSPSSNRNDSMHLCNDPTNGFSILYPSNWTRRSGECTIFGPTRGQIFADNAQTYVRISVSNTSYPNMTIRDLEQDNTQLFPEVSFKPDKDNPSSIFGLKINGSDAYARYYKWTGSPYEGLPYVNQFLDLSLSPTITTAQPTQNTTADTEFPNKLYAIYTIKNDKVYVIEYNAPTEEIWDHYLPEAKKMIESFIFI